MHLQQRGFLNSIEFHGRQLHFVHDRHQRGQGFSDQLRTAVLVNFRLLLACAIGMPAPGNLPSQKNDDTMGDRSNRETTAWVYTLIACIATLA